MPSPKPKIPKHQCQVFDYGVEDDGALYVRCRVCARTVLWCDLPIVGGGIRFEFLDKDTSKYNIANKGAMWLKPSEAEKLR